MSRTEERPPVTRASQPDSPPGIHPGSRAASQAANLHVNLLENPQGSLRVNLLASLRDNLRWGPRKTENAIQDTTLKAMAASLAPWALILQRGSGNASIAPTAKPRLLLGPNPVLLVRIAPLEPTSRVISNAPLAPREHTRLPLALTSARAAPRDLPPSQRAAHQAACVQFVLLAITPRTTVVTPAQRARILPRAPLPVPRAQLATLLPPLRARRAVCVLKVFTVLA